VFRENDRIYGVGGDQTTIPVVVNQPEVEHKVRVRDFGQRSAGWTGVGIRVKFGGYRAIGLNAGGRVHLLSYNGKDFSRSRSEQLLLRRGQLTS
jgi:hypothetical protein